MYRLLRVHLPANAVGLAQVRRQLLQLVCVVFAVVLVIGTLFWAILGGRIGDLPVMQSRFWSLGAGALVGFACAYLVGRRWRYEAGSAILLMLIIAFLFLVDYPDKITRGRGLVLAAIPIVLASAILPSIATVIVGLLVTLLTVGLSVISLHQAPDYLGMVGMILITTISWIASIGLEASVQALENNLEARQGAQEALRRRLAMEHLLSQLSSRLIALHPNQVPGEIRWALQALGQHLGADRCYISLLSAGGDITSHAYEWHEERVAALDNPTLGRSLDSLIWARVRFAGSEGLAIEQVAKLEGISEIERAAWSGLNVSSVLAMPMVLQQTLLGFIACQLEVGSRSWTDDEARLLQLSAGILANVLARSRAEVDLQQSEERLKLALAGADLGMYDWNLAADTVFVDDRYLGMLGYKPGELQLNAESFIELLHPDDRGRLQRSYIDRRMTEDRIPEFEYRMRGKEGDYHWILDRGRTMRSAIDNKPERIAGTHLDVTQRKEMEGEIRTQETRYQNLVEHLPAMVYLEDNLQVIYVSPQAESILGYSPEEYMASPTRWADVIYPPDQGKVEQAVQGRPSAHPANLEYRVVRKDGRVIWIHDESSLVFAKEGDKDYIQGIIQDITSRVEAEQAIQESQANLMLAQQIAGVGGWSLDAATGELTISEDLFRTLNTTDKTDLPVYPDTLVLYIHPDNWPQLNAAIASALAGGPDVDQQIRMFMPGDIPFYVHMKSISIRDENGKVIRLVGMIQDITARVAADETLRESRANYELTQDIARIGMWKLDAETQLIQLSDQFFRIFGISDWENVPMDLEALSGWVYPEDLPLLRAAARRALGGEGEIDLKVRLVLAGGRLYLTHIKGQARRDAAGKIMSLVGMIQDISDQMQSIDSPYESDKSS